jgi:hypothetical protein
VNLHAVHHHQVLVRRAAADRQFAAELVNVDLTRMHAAVAGSGGRNPAWQSSLGKF